MSVYKPKGSAFYHYDFQIKGRRYCGTAGTDDFEEAKALEAKVRTDARRTILYGDPVKKPAEAINDVFGRYWLEASQYTSQAEADQRRLDLIAGILGPALPFSDLDDNRVALLVAKLRGRKVGRNKRLPSNATVNRDIEALRRVWKRAAKVWKLDHGDEPNWGKHLLEETDERVRELTAEEEEALLANLRDDYHPIVRFALMSGIRVGNLRTLKWSDVDFSVRAVRMLAKSRKQGGKFHSVPLTDSMIVLLANERGKHDDFVFSYRCMKGRGARKRETWLPFTQNGWRKAWRTALVTAGISDFRFHDLRHTAATRTLRASGNMRAVQKMLGHSKITTTTRYAHALDDDIREAMEMAQSRMVPEGKKQKPKKESKIKVV
jgi:integrase